MKALSLWGPCQGQSLLYLVDLIPLGVQVLLDGLAFVSPVADSDRCVGIRLPFHQAHHVGVLGHQVSGLLQMDPHHTLRGGPRGPS